MAGQTKLLFVLLLAMTATAFGHRGSSCPHGWEEYNGRYFKYYSTKMDWISAEKYCLTLSANLMSIHNEAEYQFVKSLIRAQDPGENPTWIGLSRYQKTSTWLWSDGTQLTFTKWNPGEPNNPQTEPCGHINYEDPSTKIKDWNDVSCNNVYAFVCVKRSP